MTSVPLARRCGGRTASTWVQVEQLTLSPELKAMMLYFLLVFLTIGEEETPQIITHWQKQTHNDAQANTLVGEPDHGKSKCVY